MKKAVRERSAHWIVLTTYVLQFSTTSVHVIVDYIFITASFLLCKIQNAFILISNVLPSYIQQLMKSLNLFKRMVYNKETFNALT